MVPWYYFQGLKPRCSFMDTSVDFIIHLHTLHCRQIRTTDSWNESPGPQTESLEDTLSHWPLVLADSHPPDTFVLLCSRLFILNSIEISFIFAEEEKATAQLQETIRSWNASRLRPCYFIVAQGWRAAQEIKQGKHLSRLISSFCLGVNENGQLSVCLGPTNFKT